jgi:integrase
MREQAWLVMVIMQDSGMRPDEAFSMKIEDIDWSEHRIWIPRGKTKKARRFVAMSDRMKEMLLIWCGSRTEGWVFPSPRSKSGHLTTIAKGFRQFAIGLAWIRRWSLTLPVTPMERTPWRKPKTPLPWPTPWGMWI